MPSSGRKALFSSVEQLKRKAALSEVSGDLSRVILNVSRQHLSAIGSMHSLAEQGVRAAEATTGEIARAADEIAEGMVRLEWQVNDTREAMSELGARFEWGMSEMLAQLGGMTDSLSQLVGLATTPAQTAAYEQFEIARDAFRRRLYPECLEALDRAIDGDGGLPGYRLEWRFHMLRGVVRLGELPEVDESLINRDLAGESFASAARYAETDEPKEAARALLAASRAAYLDDHMDNAIETVQRAIDIAPDMAELHYRAAKYRATSGAFDDAVPSLRATIDADPMYLLKIASDPTFQAHETALDDFLSRVRDERISEIQPIVAAAAEPVGRWSQRCRDVADHPAWQRWQNVLDGAPGWGFFDLHRYQNEMLAEDQELMNGIVTQLVELESKIRAALASVEDEVARYSEIANHSVVNLWHDMLDLGGMEAAYVTKVDDDLARIRQQARDLEELEALVQGAHARFAKIAEHADRIRDHGTLAKWQAMIEGRRWVQEYTARFEADNAALEQLVSELSHYRIDRVVTQVEQEVKETTSEGRWLFKRTKTRTIKRLVERERTVLLNGLGDQIPGPELIEVPAAQFTIGPTKDEREDADTHEQVLNVKLTRPFLLAAMPVTQQLYEAVVQNNPSEHRGIFRPVHCLAWLDAVAFCNAMSDLYELEQSYEIQDSMLGKHVRWKGLNCNGFRLPTAAEWEYACRADSEGGRYGDLDEISWHADNSDGHPHPVGRKKPNSWGLFDMLGNVENWVWDYAPDPADARPPRRDSVLRMTAGGSPHVDAVDPIGPSRGGLRTSCGDSFIANELESVGGDRIVRRFRASARRFRSPTDGTASCGLRLARSV